MVKAFTLEAMMADAKACNARLRTNGGRLGHGLKRKARRSQVAALMDQGLNGTHIANILDENQSTICADVRAIKEERGEL